MYECITRTYCKKRDYKKREYGSSTHLQIYCTVTKLRIPWLIGINTLKSRIIHTYISMENAYFVYIRTYVLYVRTYSTHEQSTAMNTQNEIEFLILVNLPQGSE